MSLEIHGQTNSIDRHKKSKKKKVISALRDRNTSLGNRKHATSLCLSEFRTDYKDLIAMIKKLQTRPNISTYLKEISMLQRKFQV